MDNEKAKEYLKSKLADYLQLTGRDTKNHITCINPEHSDSSPSMKYDEKRWKLHCFGCSADYDIFDLVGLDHNLTEFADRYQKAVELFEVDKLETIPTIEKKSLPKVNQEDYTKYFETCHRNIESTDYWKKRGLSKEIIDRFNIGYVSSFIIKQGDAHISWEALIIPTGKSSFMARNTSDSEDRIRKFGASPIYNYQALTESVKPIFIVEGEIDALSVMEVGGEAIALGSTSNVASFLRLLDTTKPCQPLILALDNDKAGKEASIQLDASLQERAIRHYTINIAGVYKDANEALIKERERFETAVKEIENIDKAVEEIEREEYLKTSAKYQLQSFMNGIKASVNTPCIPTGFAKLDGLLDGGLYEGLYIIGAISSLGKTTFITQIADQIAQNGIDVLIFSLEMARSEIMAKSISRITVKKCLANGIMTGADTRNAKTARGITDGKRYKSYSDDEKKLIKASIEDYGSFADHIYISEGVGDIGAKELRDIIQSHIRITGRTPVVIIDYLQILSPHSERMSDKQNTDKAVMELKRISRDNKLPVIGISSFNRASYADPVSMSAFKESGAIEYSSDVLIGLQLKGVEEKSFKVDDAKSKNPREVELKVLKNRNGKTGKTSFNYYSYFNYFTEQ